MRFFLRRLVHTLIVALGVTTLVFIALRMTGDPATALLPPDATDQDILLMREKLGINFPLHVQYVRFLGDAFTGQFGVSFKQGVPAMEVVLERILPTAKLAVSALLLSCLVGIPLGIVAAVRRGSAIDYTVMSVAVVGQGVPNFWLGLMLMLIFGVILQLVPIVGSGGLESLILPAVTLAAYSTATLARLMRSTMLEVLRLDFVRTARAKGVSEGRVVLKHALKNASIPVVTLMGLQFGLLLGGTVVVEEIFAWPGVGRLLVQSIAFRDYPVVQAGTFVIAIAFVLINFVVDLSYLVLDPRIRS